MNTNHILLVNDKCVYVNSVTFIQAIYTSRTTLFMRETIVSYNYW